MKYASFWQRFAAHWIDLFVLLIPVLTLGWLSSLSKTLALICVLPQGLLFWSYTWQWHARTGQTIGKRSMGIRVVRVDGARIGQLEAFRRSSVDLTLAVASMTLLFLGLAAVPATELSSLGWLQQQQRIQQVHPVLQQWLFYVSQAWYWSEVVVMLFNARRRAIHDYLGGTVVIDETGRSPEEEAQYIRRMRMVVPVGRSGLAIAAGYLGLFAAALVPAPLALIVGIVALVDLKRHPEKLGRGRAWFGVIMGALGTLLLAGLLALKFLHR
jgi:uncharacterized RDD family membrane protein YckC